MDRPVIRTWGDTLYGFAVFGGGVAIFALIVFASKSCAKAFVPSGG